MSEEPNGETAPEQIADAAVLAGTEQEKLEHESVMIALSNRIHNNQELREMLRQAQPEYRKAIYEGVKTHCKFFVLSYMLVKP